MSMYRSMFLYKNIEVTSMYITEMSLLKRPSLICASHQDKLDSKRDSVF